MKTITVIIAVLAVVIGVAFAFVGCADKDFDLPTNEEFNAIFSTFDKVSGGEAFELFGEVYAQFIMDSYKSVSYFEFNANVLGGINAASQQSKTVKKFDGDKFYKEMVTVGTGEGKANLAEKFYYDSQSAHAINIDDENIVPGKGSGDELFTVNDYGNFALYTGTSDELAEKLRIERERMTFYDTTKREYLGGDHDNSVYTRDNKLYITLTLECSREAMRSFNKAAMDEFIRALGIKPNDEDSFNMLKNSTLKIIIGKIDGKNKMLGFQLAEKYEGKARGLTAKAHQTNSTMIYYGAQDYAITDTDIAGLN